MAPCCPTRGRRTRPAKSNHERGGGIVLVQRGTDRKGNYLNYYPVSNASLQVLLLLILLRPLPPVTKGSPATSQCAYESRRDRPERLEGLSHCVNNCAKARARAGLSGRKTHHHTSLVWRKVCAWCRALLARSGYHSSVKMPRPRGFVGALCREEKQDAFDGKSMH